MAAKRSPKPKRAANVDRHVGGRLRLRRTVLGISQTTLADRIGISFQQVQKYERGSNRISASRLCQFAQVLDVPVVYFFDGLGGKGLRTATPAESDSHLLRRETLQLVRAYYRIPDPAIRKALYDFVVTAAQNK